MPAEVAAGRAPAKRHEKSWRSQRERTLLRSFGQGSRRRQWRRLARRFSVCEMSAGTPFPVRAVALFVTVLVALGLALVCALFAIGVDGHPDDVLLIVGGHQLGGPTDDMIANILAFVFGTAGVACVLKGWRSVREAVFGRLTDGGRAPRVTA